MHRGTRIGVIAGAAAGALAAGWTAWSYFSTKGIERPRYRVAARKDGYELREYEPSIVAETDVEGGPGEAFVQGFRRLFRYVSGDNMKRARIAMTAPVAERTETPSEKPGRAGNGVHTVSFVMPSKYTLDTLPVPNTARVRLRHRRARRVAVKRFSGFPTAARIEKMKKSLLEELRQDRLTPAATPETAVYNPPFTVPFLRRTEVMVELAPQ